MSPCFANGLTNSPQKAAYLTEMKKQKLLTDEQWQLIASVLPAPKSGKEGQGWSCACAEPCLFLSRQSSGYRAVLIRCPLSAVSRGSGGAFRATTVRLPSSFLCGEPYAEFSVRSNFAISG